MLKSTIIGFQSPKTAGSTIISLNLAILHQITNPDKKIAFIQMTYYPNANLYSGKLNKYSILDLINFIDTRDWGENLINDIKTNQGCDIFHSPSQKYWTSLDTNNLQKIFNLIFSIYDFVYIDINNSIQDEVKNIIYSNLDNLILINSLDPISISALDNFLESNEKISKIKIIINQCPNFEIGKIRGILNKKDIDILGLIGTDTKSVWHNVFEGFPVSFLKRSKLKKDLLKISSEIVNLYKK